jgi:hypothetical protein
MGMNNQNIKFLNPLYIPVLQNFLIHPIYPSEFSNPDLLTISPSVIQMQIIAKMAIAHAKSEKIIDPVLFNIVSFLKKIPEPIVEPRTMNITDRKLTYFFCIFR